MSDYEDPVPEDEDNDKDEKARDKTVDMETKLANRVH